MFVLFAGILLLFTSRQVTAQKNASKQSTEQYQGEKKMGEVAPSVWSRVKVSGVVKSPEEGYVMPGVNVVLKGTMSGTTTDVDGKFELTLENLHPSQVLVFSFIGFQSVEYPVGVAKPEQYIHVDMITEMTSLGGIVFGGVTARRWYSPGTWWWRVRGLFRR